MGCTVTTDERGTTVARDASSPLVGIDVDMSDVSDLVPTVAVVAAAATTPTTVRGVGFIRSKESDRLGDLAAELTRTGADIVETDDGLHVEPVPPGALHGAHLATHHDHRLAMAFAVLATAVPGIDLDDPYGGVEELARLLERLGAAAGVAPALSGGLGPRKCGRGLPKGRQSTWMHAALEDAPVAAA